MTAETEIETPLVGGRVTEGVVRVGNTLRRPPTGNSGFVRGLLAHLAANGFDEAPRPLGVDEKGRDIFSFIVGEVPADLAFHDDATLAVAAALIRRYHDATTGLVTGACARSADIVCHNDLSPCNFVFRDDRPVARSSTSTQPLPDTGMTIWAMRRGSGST